MNDQLKWQSISTAPFDHDLEIAVIEREQVHTLVFACRRVRDGWIKVQTNEHVMVSPTHWRSWTAGN